MAEQADAQSPEEQFLAQFPENVGEDTKPDATDTPQDAATPEAEGTTQEDTFSKTDLDSLLDGITDPAARTAVESAYKSFQGDYTRKTQELAAARASYGDNPEEVQEAVEFYSNLREDPAFALEVHGYLSNALQEMGMTPSQADEEATRQTQGGEVTVPADIDADEDDPTAPLKSQVETLQERLDRFEMLEKERQERAQEDELAATLIQQEMSLRHTHPDLQEKDFDRIYDLAVSVGGNLHEAYSLYDEMRSDFITGYMESKGSVSDRVDSPAAAPSASQREVPHDERGNVDLESVHKAAMQTLFNHMAEREAHG